MLLVLINVWFWPAFCVVLGRAADPYYTGTFEDAAAAGLFWPIRFTRWFFKALWAELRGT